MPQLTVKDMRLALEENSRQYAMLALIFKRIENGNRYQLIRMKSSSGSQI